MDSGDILLGQPWIYDKNETHGIQDNTYMFVHDGKHFTLHPKKPELLNKGSRAHITKETLQVHNFYKDNSRRTQV